MIKASLQVPTQYFDFMEKKLGQSADEALIAAARLTCQKLAVATFPKGTSGKTFETLKKTIYKDINNAYVIADSITNTAHDDGTYLLRHRTTSRRRVPEGTTRLPISRGNYEELKEKFVKTAGMVKAGWLEAASELGKTRTPVWLRKPDDLATTQKMAGTIIVVNKVKYASALITTGQIKNAMTSSFRGLIKRAEKQIVKK